MIVLLHRLILACYVAVPAVVFWHAVRGRQQKQNRNALGRFGLTAVGGMLMGGVVCGAHAAVLHGSVMPVQVLLCGYFATGLLLLLKGFDRLLSAAVDRLFGVRGLRRAGLVFAFRQLLARSTRAVVLLAVGLPYVLAACLTYRTHVAIANNPQTTFGWAFDAVSFDATDGVRLAGWWIPAAGVRSDRTVVFCHGLAGSKATQLFLVRQLVPAGYNVLTFDFRGVGGSAGQLTTFGDLERSDVLGAVRWLRETHPAACRHVLGLGVGTGGASLLAASADPGVDGRMIDAVAVYAGFDRLDAITRDLAEQYLSPPFAPLLTKIGLAMASVQCGANLSDFAPENAAAQLWPRPLLVLQAVDDPLVDFDRGQALFDRAMQPKSNDWVEHVTHEGLLESDDAARFVREFFDSAKSVI